MKIFLKKSILQKVGYSKKGVTLTFVVYFVNKEIFQVFKSIESYILTLTNLLTSYITYHFKCVTHLISLQNDLMIAMVEKISLLIIFQCFANSK